MRTFSVYMVRVTRPALMLSRKCFESIEVIFSVDVQLNCDSSQKNSAVVIFFKKNYRSFFIACGKKSGGEKDNINCSCNFDFLMKGLNLNDKTI